MADLKLLTERVVEKEKAAIRQEVEEAKVQAEDDVQAAEAEEVQKRAKTKEEIKASYEQEYTIRKNTLDIKRRNEVLAGKQAILTNVFKEAKFKLDHLEKEPFKAFTLNVLNQFKDEKEIHLMVGEKSVGSIDNAWLTLNKPDTLSVILSEETVPKQSGLLIEKDGIEYNFLFDALIEDARIDILPEISKELF
ncbi:MAG: V-type ATP synthase subunit E [Alkalibacterium sp.]|nr:V-type ATP synthase subunit E [Alkalibacterium sp.]